MALEIYNFLKLYLSSIGKSSDINDDTKIRELGLDSLDLIELWIDMETNFKLSIPEKEFDKVITVKDLINLIGKYARK